MRRKRKQSRVLNDYKNFALIIILPQMRKHFAAIYERQTEVEKTIVLVRIFHVNDKREID